MSSTLSYETLTARNSGYVSADAQQRMRHTRLLVAGCGIGSSLAVCAARMGFERFVLVDGDVVDAHNLNRQFYNFDDIGRPKVEALKAAILRINPNAQIEALHTYLDARNAPEIVARSDIVFDTVDFLDLPAILALHDSANAQRRPVFTALSVGFGALVWYFPAGGLASLSEVIAADLASVAGPGSAAPVYADVFGAFIRRLAPYLDAEVIEQISTVLALMKEGRPCPASQVAVGSFAIGALAMSMMAELLEGRDLPASPKLVVHSFRSQRTTIVDLSEPR